MLDELRTIRYELRTIRRFVSSGYDESLASSSYNRLIDHVIAADGRYADPLCLARYSASIFSQTGEDGMIAEIFNRIGTKGRYFVETGVEDGTQNTTRFLLENGWRGTWIEASDDHARSAAKLLSKFIDNGQLRIVNASVTAENINGLMNSAGVPDEIDFLSIDIDYNTPHVWDALKRRSRAACIEYNGHLPSNISMCVPYDANKVWDGQTIWFGGSLKTMENIGRDKKMALVGCDLSGINAFFVAASETEGRFRAPFTAETHYQRARAHMLLPSSLSIKTGWIVQSSSAAPT